MKQETLRPGSGQAKNCQNCKQEFVIEPEDFAFYEKIKVPAPTFCSSCRLQRRMAFRNERNLYKRECGLCGKGIISIYSSDKPFPVYCRECWWSDNWDSESFALEVDFTKPFLTQFKELSDRVPKVNFFGANNTNSEYTNYTWDSKDCYLSYSIIGCEQIYYTKTADKSRNCYDCLHISNSELLYWCVGADKCYSSQYLNQCRECMASAFLFDCVNCRNCFMSSGLRNKEYVFRNIQLDKDGYLEELSKIDFENFEVINELKKEFLSVREKAIHKYADILKSVNSNGEAIANCKNVQNCYYIFNSENCKYGFRGHENKEVYDFLNSVGTELAYEVTNIGLGSYDLKFTMNTSTNSRGITYSENCETSSDLFGCSGLRNKKFCILNKQYSEKEYNELKAKIIEHMENMPYIDKRGVAYKYGEFFPIELSPFAYNESFAKEYFPLEESEINERGYGWKKPEIRENQAAQAADVIECKHGGSCSEQCTPAFKTINSELEFYKKFKISIPRLCPNCRHYERLRFMNPFQLWHRQCMCDKKNHSHGEKKCPNEFETSYAPDRPEIVYCEQCYNSEVA